MGKTKGPTWKHFRVKGKEVFCKYCGINYKYGNVNKMEKHILKCLKCPNDLKKDLKCNVNVQMQTQSICQGTVANSGDLEEVQSSSQNIIITNTLTPTPESTPKLPKPSLAFYSRPASQMSQRSLLDSFVDNMTFSENVSFTAGAELRLSLTYLLHIINIFHVFMYVIVMCYVFVSLFIEKLTNQQTRIKGFF